MYIIGISAFYHDSAAALVKDGILLLAAQEERFTRVKNDSAFPTNAIKFLLEEEGIRLEDVDHFVFYDKPWRKFERITETLLNFTPKSFPQFLMAMPSWLGEKLNFRKLLSGHFKEIDAEAKAPTVLFSEHHFSHAASTFYTSPFEEACVVNVDGVGEWATLTIYQFTKDGFTLLEQMDFPNSIGILYSAFTYFCGFRINSGEYKLMGLAPYGQEGEETNIFLKKILENLVKIKEDGSVEINLDYFKYHYGRHTIDEKKWKDLFGIKTRNESDKVEQSYCNFALASQKATEQILMRIIHHAKEITQSHNLCLAGGVALNCVANAKLRQANIFENIWIHPAPGDAGGAVGAALGYYFSQNTYEPLKSFSPYLGPRFSNFEIEKAIKKYKLQFEFKTDSELFEFSANELIKSKIFGWFQGRLEWGPRALGNRSIIANPCDTQMQKDLNLKIKFREGFRPFAPVATQEGADKYFETAFHNPYMQYVHRVKGFEPTNFKGDFFERLKKIKSPMPAITHLDGTARLQTVSVEENPRLHKLITTFEKKSGYPVLINTSFNVRGEPIVCTPEDAIECFLSTHLDYLVLENYILSKEKNKEIARNFIARDFAKD